MTWDTINVTSVGRSATGAPNNQTEGPLRKTPRHLEAPCISAPRFGFRMARGPVRAREAHGWRGQWMDECDLF